MVQTQTTSPRFRSAVVLVMLVILGTGLMRLFAETRGGNAVEAERAEIWASCLGTVSVAQNTALTLSSLASDPASKTLLSATAATNLSYVSTEAVPIDPIDPKLSLRTSRTEPFTLPQYTELRVQKGEFWLSGSAAAQVGDAALLFRTSDRLRFGPAPNSNYIISLSEEVPIGAQVEGQPHRLLPQGTTGTLKLDRDKLVPLVTLDATAATPLLLHSSPSLLPVRAFGEKGPAALSIETRQQALTGKTLTACAIAQGTAYPIAVTDVAPGADGITNVVLNVPSDVLPDTSLLTLVDLAVASTDGQYTAHGSFVAFSRLYASIIATLFTGLLFWGLLHVRHMKTVPNSIARKNEWGRFFAGLFISEGDNDPSLSLFQVFFWTAVTVWGFFYSFTVTGSLLKMTPEMMVLLGIAGTGSVLARWIAISRGGSTSQPTGSEVQAPADAQRAEPLDFWQILNTNGQFDLLKLQLLLFTLLIGVYVICRIAESASFPVLDTNTLLLLGVSQGVYIGGKLGGTTPLARAQALKLDLDLAAQAAAKLAAEIRQLEEDRDTFKKEKEALDQEIQTLGETANRTDDQTERLSMLRKQASDKEAAIAALDATINKKNADLSSANDKVKELEPSLEQAVKDIGLAT
ncbi:hypothetical protein NKH17_24870 [Mesorhizobium sp. M1334]|uniref:hypothetical protein n=1 Tax=Mesorhizobium sp. M1334 TaxID=2957084 RepID=UPI00333D1C5E